MAPIRSSSAPPVTNPRAFILNDCKETEPLRKYIRRAFKQSKEQRGSIVSFTRRASHQLARLRKDLADEKELSFELCRQRRAANKEIRDLRADLEDQELLAKQGEVRKRKLYRKIGQAEQTANVARLGLTALEEEAMVMKEKLDKVLPDLIVETNLTPSSKNFSAIAPEITCPICYGTMRSVVQIEECGHSLCSPCLFKTFHYSKRRKCPLCRATVTSPPRPDDRVQNIAKAFPDPEPQDDSCDAEIGYEGIESWKKMFSADVGSL
ncbi:hypothetical protein IW262DRAFT_1461544 [Armillaria fumosa]|nr:hypothetical protein IW262DRAFT_1461544 [Armillaria fumosa]